MSNGPDGNCSSAYSFRHEVSLTSNVTAFQAVLDRVRLSGGLDPAEGILDALLQTAICEVCLYVVCVCECVCVCVSVCEGVCVCVCVCVCVRVCVCV